MRTNKNQEKLSKRVATGMLIRGSWRIIKTDKKILLIPALAAVINILVTGISLIIVNKSELITTSSNSLASWVASLVYGILLYLIIFTSSNYFNVAFLSVVAKRLKGETSSIKGGFQMANKKIKTIFVYSLIAATIGGLIDKATESLPLIPSVVSILVGVAWSLVSIFTIPVIVVTDQKPYGAIKSSARTIKDKWGQVVIGDWLGLGLLGLLSGFMFIIVPLTAAIAIYSYADPQMTFDLAEVPVISYLIVGVGFAMCIMSFFLLEAIRKIFFMALYLDSATDFNTSAFDERLYRQAFRPKKKLFS